MMKLIPVLKLAVVRSVLQQACQAVVRRDLCLVPKDLWVLVLTAEDLLRA